MLIPRKSRYALRAVLELALRREEGPVKMNQIAKAQAIPPRFLEAILAQLKQGGFIDSRRGSEGGYRLARDPGELAVGEILRFFQGPLEPVACLGEHPKEKCPLRADCVFAPMWEEAKAAVASVYDSTTMQDLVERAGSSQTAGCSDYQI